MMESSQTFKAISPILAVAFLCATPAVSQGAGFLTHGAAAKAGAGAGEPLEAGAVSSFYNPANCKPTGWAVVRPEVYSEVSVIDVGYRYETPGFEPVEIRIQTPALFVANSIPLSQRWFVAWGVLPVPGGSGDLSVERVPSRQLDRNGGLIDVATRTRGFGYQAAIATSYEISRRTAVGVAFRQDLSQGVTKVSDSLSGQDLFRYESTTRVQNFTLGTSGRIREHANIGLTYRSPPRFLVTGEFQNEGGESFRKSALGGPVVGIHGSIEASRWTPFGAGWYTQDSKSKGTLNPFVADDQQAVETYDAVSIAGGGVLRVTGRQRLILAAGWYPTTVGQGSVASEANGYEEISGIQFGDLNAISRRVVSGGYRYLGKGRKFDASTAWHNGHREVDDQSRGYGTYDLNVFVFSGGLSWKL